ncbi:MAG TPA: response regulator [Bryobacteraceae bacterium]|jgi:DNA-binding NtrC family response regulator|nr:response regulator [Bryobacteraceae bacterium]
MKPVAQIVAVDDDQQVLNFLKNTLESKGYEVRATTSPKSALAMVEQKVPDLLITDLNMPNTDGFEVLRTQRSRFPGLRILVISGHMHSDLLEAASLLGATATLEKPVSGEALLTAVRDVIGK